jgi:hypothetical protein
MEDGSKNTRMEDGGWRMEDGKGSGDRETHKG